MTETLHSSRMIIGMSGASGATYGISLLKTLQEMPIETHLVVSKSAHITLKHELDLSLEETHALADYAYPFQDIAAPIASGSYMTQGMIIAPCSIRTMSEIATGVTSSLLTRAADVVLKERRKLVLMVRETPLHLGHLRTMTQLAEMGAIIFPAIPSFYHNPTSIDELIAHTIGRVLDLYQLDSGYDSRWEGITNK